MSQLRILIPRHGQDSPMANAVREAGMEPVCVPLTEISTAPDEILADAIEFDALAWLVLTSPRSVSVLRNYARSSGKALGPRIKAAVDNGMRVAAVGPATAEALRVTGAPVHLIAPAPGSARTLVEAFPAPEADRDEDERWILLPCSALASHYLAEQLSAKGWTVERLETYTTVPTQLSAETKRLLTDPWPDAVWVTSASTAHALNELGTPPPSCRLIAIGEPTARALRELDLQVAAVAAEPTPDALLSATKEAL